MKYKPLKLIKYYGLIYCPRNKILTLSYNDEDLFKTLVHRDDINLNGINKKGFTPLHNAVKLNDFDLVSFILNSKRNKTSIDSKTNDG